MKKVTRTKKPSIPQMSNMAFNLHEKFKEWATVQVSCSLYFSGDLNLQYWLSGQKIEGDFYDSWKEVQDKYFELMEG